MKILPTHTCFDDALELLSARVKDDRQAVDSLVLVHGICLGPADGTPFVHAWLEESLTCWDAGLLEGQRVYMGITYADFYATLRPQDVTRYSVMQALIENLRTGHYGPWVDRYRALCTTDRHTLGEVSLET